MGEVLSSSSLALVDGWLPQLTALAIKGTAVLVLAFAAAWALRRMSASTRHLVWSAGLTVVLALPLASALLPWRLEVLPRLRPGSATAWVATGAVEERANAGAVASPWTTASSPTIEPRAAVPQPEPEGAAAARPADSAPASLLARSAADGGEGAGVGEVDPAAPSGTSPVPAVRPAAMPLALTIVLAAWLAGALILLARLVVGVVAVRRLAKRSTELATSDWTTPLWEAADRLDLARVPRLLRSDDVALPFTCGLFRPVIVLPAAADAWSDERRRAVLFHELAHIRRRDLPSHLLGRVACAVYWIHPLVWLAARRARAESERACDDLVLSIGTRASSYADHLLQIVCSAARSSAPAVAIPMAQRKEFEGRMLAILEAGVRRAAPGRWQSAGIVTGAAALALSLAAMAPARPGGAGLVDESNGAADDGVVTLAALDGSPDGAEGEPARGTAGDGVSLQAENGVPAAPGERGTGVVAAMRAATGAESSGRVAPDRDPRDHELASLAPVPADTDHVHRHGAFEFQWDGGDFGESVGEYVGPIVDMSIDATMAAMGADWSGHFGYAVPAPLAAPAPMPAPMPAPTARGWRDADPPRHAPKPFRYRRGGTRDADPETIAALVAALRDSVVEVRSGAVYALGQIADPEAVAALAKALREDEDAEVRRMAAWALGEIGDPAAVPALGVAVREDKDAGVRRMAAWALGEIEDPRAVAALGAAVRDSAPDVAKMAVWALGEIEAPAAAPHLIAALRNTSAEVRRHAAWALGELESSAAVAPLTAALRDRNAEVRRMAVWALGEIGDPRAATGLASALRDSAADVRRSAAWALGELDVDRAPAPLLAALGDATEEVRRMSAWALGEIADPAAAPALTKALEDTSRDVRRTALWALGEIGGEPARDALLKAIRSGDPEIRKLAAQALANTY